MLVVTLNSTFLADQRGCRQSACLMYVLRGATLNQTEYAHLRGGRQGAQALVKLLKVLLELLFAQLRIWGYPRCNLRQLRVLVTLLPRGAS